MDSMERQVYRAKRRLLLNAWLRRQGLCLGSAAGLFLLITLITRMGGLDWPLLPIGGVLLGAAALISLVWAALTAADTAQAAVALDKAVGLKERVSSGLYCRELADPFARAVRRDAARAVSGISVRAHLPVRWPDAMSLGSGAIILSLLVFWLLPTMDLFGRQEQERQHIETRQRLEVQQAAVLTQVARLKHLKEQNPALAENKEFETELDAQAAKLETPLDLQRDMVKKLENLMDSVEKQQQQQKYDSLGELKKMLRRLQEPLHQQAPVSQVADALSKGDFKAAQQALNKLQDELAKHEQEGNREQIEQLQQQLETLGKKIEKLAGESKKLEDALKQAGIKPEDMKRMLENLSKKDFEAVQKQLQQSGLTQEQIDKLMKKLVNCRMAQATASKLGAALQAAAQGSAQSAGSQALAGLAEASEVLGEAEQLALELSQLESTLAQLADMKNQAGCPACQGVGCAACQGDQPGRGMGRLAGQGRGGLAPEQETDLGFKKERTPVHTTPGGVIGSFLIKGSQFKRESAAEFNEVFISSEKDVSEAIARDKVPPYARKTVKEYFLRGQRDLPAQPPTGERAAGSSQDTDKE